MPFVHIPHSPLARRPVDIHYREFGSGAPIVFLHGGWGYHLYPINKQLHELHQYRILIPDRSGYGLSTKPAELATDFHARAAEETLMFLDALAVDQAILWGHSDGSVIAAHAGLQAPNRCRGLILEAFHYFRRKTNSRAFFETMATAPEDFGPRVSAVLAHEHGEGDWRELVKMEGKTWLEIAKLADTGTEDLFDGKIGRLQVPSVFIHGVLDPRTDPGEIAAVEAALPEAKFHWISNGEHCPHSEKNSALEFTRELKAALAYIDESGEERALSA